MYKQGICPRLNWMLTIEEFPITWIQRQLEATATRYLKRCAGIAKSANPNILYLPYKLGGCQLPAITSLYKCLQVSKQSQLLTSNDATVRHIAEEGLQMELKTVRRKFRPAVEVQQTLVKIKEVGNFRR